MTGMELVNLAAMDLRDHESLTGASHTLYPLREKLARLKSGLRFLATELARERCNRVMKEALSGSTEWPAAITPGRAWLDLPADHLAVLEVYLAGRERDLGPLPLASREDRFRAGSEPTAYYLAGGRLYLTPTPAEEVSLRLVWAAWPELCLQGEPADESQASAQLESELPAWVLLFAESLRQFIVLGCANRGEYDTTVEQGLYQMLKSAAAEAAALEDLGGWDREGPGGLWTGSEL
ncbi:hypothetical protein AAU61_14440 [Desulfocarbo indianensis]|nr:hypothetical protein AAU61_14440 [Desulfocarbo indianensis]